MVERRKLKDDWKGSEFYTISITKISYQLLGILTMNDRILLSQSIIKIVLSLLFTISFFYSWNSYVIMDDAAIILRYMDNFAKGYFYSYNPLDGPIFGISGFIHGVLSGLFAYSHIFSPLNSLFASNFIGVFLISLFSFLIISLYNKNPWVLYGGWLLLINSCPHFIITSRQGLETPLHLAILLILIYFFLNKKSKGMCLFFALSVISKLDALPIVIILAVLYWFQISSGKERFTYIKNLLIFTMIPGILWIIFAYMIFGSPFPQSAFAKLYYHNHPSNHLYFFYKWFREMKYLFMIFIILFGFSFFTLLFSKKYKSIARDHSIGLCSFGYFALYFYYNPAEQMAWYYTVPEFLIFLQMIILIPFLAFEGKSLFMKWLPKDIKDNELKSKKILQERTILFILLCYCLIAVIQTPKVRKIKDGVIWYGNVVDRERIAIGKWVKEHSRPDDSLFAGHGHIAREAGIYTIDYTGLNSKIVTQYKRDFNLLVKKLKPDWIVVSGLLAPALQEEERYSLRKSFYNLSGKWDTQSWRIFEKIHDPSSSIPILIKLDKNHLKNARSLNLFNGYYTIMDSYIVLDKFQTIPSFDKIITGLVKKSFPISLNISILGKDNQLLNEQNFLLEQIDMSDKVNGISKEMEITVNPEQEIYQIIIKSYNNQTKEPIDIEMVEPIIQRH